MESLIAISLLILLLMVVVLWGTAPTRKYKVVKAGDPMKEAPLSILKKNLYNKTYNINGNVVNPRNYEIFIVEGDSMGQVNVKSGDAIFVKKINDFGKLNIKQNTVLLFEIDHKKDLDNCEKKKLPKEYKLRRFVQYIKDDNEFNRWINSLHCKNNEIDNIRSKYSECIKIYKNNNSNQDCVFSLSTTSTENGTISYSFHPLKFLYGTAEYVIAKSDVG